MLEKTEIRKFAEGLQSFKLMVMDAVTDVSVEGDHGGINKLTVCMEFNSQDEALRFYSAWQRHLIRRECRDGVDGE